MHTFIGSLWINSNLVSRIQAFLHIVTNTKRMILLPDRHSNCFYVEFNGELEELPDYRKKYVSRWDCKMKDLLVMGKRMFFERFKNKMYYGNKILVERAANEISNPNA
jgi:hypothetical protein